MALYVKQEWHDADLDDEKDARAAVQSMIDQVPEGGRVFTILDRD